MQYVYVKRELIVIIKSTLRWNVVIVDDWIVGLFLSRYGFLGLQVSNFGAM